MHILVKDLTTGKTIHSCWYHQLRDVWEPTSEAVAAFYKVPAEDVHCGEHELHGDVIEINGKAVATIEHVYRRVELRRPIYSEAAE
jgi:hypothetical protein